MKKMIDFEILSNEKLNDQNHLLKITPVNNEKLPPIYPGQFVEIYVSNSKSTFLRRPISINFVDELQNTIWLLIQNVGDGTAALCDSKIGQKLNIIFPLGNSFTLPDNQNKRTLLVGGGVGIAPLLLLGKVLKNNGFLPEFLLGGRSATDVLQMDEFEKFGKINITTEDGSLGEKGFVTHHSVLANQQFDKIYACGPKPMMVASSNYAHKHDIECEVSLENMMACGFGACLCCVEKTIRGNVCVCTEGPVFNIKELTWID